MANGTVKYRLPRTRVIVSGTIRRSRDELGAADPPPLEEANAEVVSVLFSLVTDAEPAELTASVPRGPLRTYKGSFAMTSDGRLTKASVETTGALGTVVKSVAAIAGTVVGAIALAGGETDDDESALRRLLDANAGELAAYKLEFEGEHDAGVRLASMQRDVRGRLLQATTDAVQGQVGIGRLREFETLQRSIAAQLAPIEVHYRAWRATKITTVEESFEFAVALADVPDARPSKWGDPAVTQSAAAPKNLMELWQRAGATVTITWTTSGRQPQAWSGAADAAQAIVVRRPDILTMQVVEQRSKTIVGTSRSQHVAVDDHSTHEVITLDKSWWGRRSVDLAFDGDGLLSGIGFEGSAVAGEIGEAVAALPGSYSGGIEAATKVSTALAAARRAGAEATLAQVKNDVELRQQRLTAAGLDATSADYVRLQRLTQLQSILDAQAKIGAADPRLVDDIMRTASGDLSWYEAPAPAAAAEPQVVRVVIEGGGVTVPAADREHTPQQVPPSPTALGGDS